MVQFHRKITLWNILKTILGHNILYYYVGSHLIKHIYLKHNGINLVIDFLKRENNF